MSDYIIPLIAFAIGLANVWRKDRRILISGLLLLTAVVATWHAWESAQAREAEADRGRRLTAELLGGYHKLSSLVFLASLQSDATGDVEASASFDDALNHFPLADALGSKSTHVLLSFARIGEPDVDMEISAVGAGDDAMSDDGRSAWWQVSIDGSSRQGAAPPLSTLKFGPHTLQVEEIAPDYTFVLDLPVAGPGTRQAITLPRALELLSKGRTVGSLTFATTGAISDESAARFRDELDASVRFAFKSYVTDNRPDEPSETEAEGESDGDEESEGGWQNVRPHLYYRLRLGAAVRRTGSVQIELIVADHPHLWFTEAYPW